jgi:hypothetical protein
MHLEDLVSEAVLGEGAFGTVKLVMHKVRLKDNFHSCSAMMMCNCVLRA